MSSKIFVNLPVADLKKSMAFFENLGYTINPQYSDETAACIVVSEDIYFMLLTHAKFKEFTPKSLTDAFKTTEVINALSSDSKAELDQLVDKAMASGATENGDPKDYGFMYTRSFNDLDGHIWEYIYMDPAAQPPHQ